MEKVAVITGASGGLGSAMARQFAADGTRVVVNCNRSREAAQSVAEEINSASPGMAMVCKADVGSYQEVQGMVAQTLKTWGRIDILVNNAGAFPVGTSFPTGSRREGSLIIDMEEDEWDWFISSQLKGPFNCIKAVAPHMIEQREGHIINVGAIIGFKGYAGKSAYAAAKGGLIGLSRTAARELGQYNIKVNMVIPGPVPHPRLEWAFHPSDKKQGVLGRDQTPEEFALVIVNLSKLQNVSGQIFALENRITL